MCIFKRVYWNAKLVLKVVILYTYLYTYLYCCVLWYVCICLYIETRNYRGLKDSRDRVPKLVIHIYIYILLCVVVHIYMYVCILTCAIIYRLNHRSLLQKSPIKETIFCKRDYIYIHIYIYLYLYWHAQLSRLARLGRLLCMWRVGENDFTCMSHMWMSHVTHANESCHTCEWVMSRMRHVSHVNESCHTCEWGMSHMWMRHVTHVNEARHTCEWVLSHMWTSHCTRATYYANK